MNHGFCAGLAQTVRDDDRECEQGDALEKSSTVHTGLRGQYRGQASLYPQRGLHDLSTARVARSLSICQTFAQDKTVNRMKKIVSVIHDENWTGRPHSEREVYVFRCPWSATKRRHVGKLMSKK